MGLSFRKSIKIGKNTRINLSKSGVGLSTGVKGARISVGPKGVRKTIGIPGTGIYHTEQKSWSSINKQKQNIENETLNAVIKNKNADEEIIKVSIPKRINIMFWLSMISVVASFIFIPLALIGLPVVVITSIMMIVDKDYRYALKIQLAIKAIAKNDREGAIYSARKALKYKPNDELANRIICRFQ